MVYLHKSKHGSYCILEKVKEDNEWKTKQVESLGKISKDEAEKRLDELIPVSKKRYQELINNENWLYQKYCKEKLSAYEIAKILECGNTAVYRALKRFSIPLCSSSEAHTSCGLKRWEKQRKCNPFINDKNWLHYCYIIKKESIKDIAKKANVGYQTTRKALLRFGISIREKGKGNRETLGKTEAKNYKFLDNKEWLYQKYLGDKLTIKKIAEIIGCSSGIVWDALKRHNIKRRTYSEVLKTQSFEEREPRIKKLREARKKLRLPKHHTKPELIFEVICEKYNLHFKYVGDGQLWIGKEKMLNPDFIEADGQKIVIDILGEYWHSPLRNYKVPEYANLNYRKKHFKKYGWHSIFIWETDLLREDAEDFVLSRLQKEGIKW